MMPTRPVRVLGSTGLALLVHSMLAGRALPFLFPSAWTKPSSGGYSSSDSLGQSSPTALWSAAPPTASSSSSKASSGSSSSPVSSLAIGLDPIGRIDANAADLLDWVARGRGEKHPGVTVSNVPSSVEGYYPDPELGRWTLEATQAIPAGTVLVSIPNVLTLSPVRRRFAMPPGAGTGGLRELLASRGVTVEESVLRLLEASATEEKVQAVMDRFPQAYWRLKLAIALVAERMKGPKSFWWPYLRNLPEKYAYMPIFYNNSEFGSIQIPSLMKTVQSRCRMLVNISDGYLRQLKATPDENPFLDDVHANDMGWGLCAASSRALRHVPGLTDRPGQPPVMVPVIDLCQHSLTPNCYIKDYREAGGSIQLVAGRALSPGEMLTISYGNLSNSELLLDYGFTLPANPHDRFDFSLSDDLIRASQRLMAFDTEAFGDKRVPGLLQPWQERVLTDLGLAPKVNGTPYWPPVKMSLGGPGKVDGRLLALLRVMYCRDRRLLAMSNVTYGALQAYNTPFRIATFERRAIMHALGVAATLLRRLPTTLTEDWRLLTGQSLHISHDEHTQEVVFESVGEGGDSRDELMETVTTDEAVVKEYNPYREAELMERREPVIQYMGPAMNRCMREILAFRIAQKKILYRVISDTCHAMYGYGLVQSVQDMEELEEERRLMASPEETARPASQAALLPASRRSLETILSWADQSFGDEAGGL